MKRLVLIVVAALAAVAVLGAVRRVLRPRLLGLMDRMMEDVMPGMMDACFGQMPAERREFMLAHCRGALDHVEAKYVRGETGEEPVPAPAEVA